MQENNSINDDFNSMVVKDENYQQNDTGTIIEYKNKNTNQYNFDTMIEHKHEVLILYFSLISRVKGKLKISNIIILCTEISKIKILFSSKKKSNNLIIQTLSTMPKKWKESLKKTNSISKTIFLNKKSQFMKTQRIYLLNFNKWILIKFKINLISLKLI